MSLVAQSIYSTYAVTIRPRGGITDSDIALFSDWVKKACQYYYIITEKLGDERHVHSAVVLKKPKCRSNVATALVRLFKHYDAEERAVLQKGLKILYNYDFVQNYMNKDDDTVIIENNLPEASFLESYFPPKPVSGFNRRLAHHELMVSYEAYWRKYMAVTDVVNTQTVRDFLFRLQYKERVIGLMDDKRLCQTAKWFTRWWHKSDTCPTHVKPSFESDEGPGIHDNSFTWQP